MKKEFLSYNQMLCLWSVYCIDCTLIKLLLTSKNQLYDKRKRSHITKSDGEQVLKNIDTDKYRMVNFIRSLIDQENSSTWSDASMATENVEVSFGETMLILKDKDFSDTIYIPYSNIKFI